MILIHVLRVSALNVLKVTCISDGQLAFKAFPPNMFKNYSINMFSKLQGSMNLCNPILQEITCLIGKSFPYGHYLHHKTYLTSHSCKEFTLVKQFLKEGHKGWRKRFDLPM